MQSYLVDWFLYYRKIAIKCHIQKKNNNMLKTDNKTL